MDFELPVLSKVAKNGTMFELYLSGTSYVDIRRQSDNEI